jgi:hypothetical protein
MRRTTAILLVLMGGDATVMASPLRAEPSQPCRDAQAAQRPDADEICGISLGGGHGSWSGAVGHRPAPPEATPDGAAAVERGGFGATGWHVHWGG